jgi:hypothetical protein
MGSDDKTCTKPRKGTYGMGYTVQLPVKTISETREQGVASSKDNIAKQCGAEIDIARLCTVEDQLGQTHKVLLLCCRVLQKLLGVEHDLGHLEPLRSKVEVVSVWQLIWLLWSRVNVSVRT